MAGSFLDWLRGEYAVVERNDRMHQKNNKMYACCQSRPESAETDLNGRLQVQLHVYVRPRFGLYYNRNKYSDGV